MPSRVRVAMLAALLAASALSSRESGGEDQVRAMIQRTFGGPQTIRSVSLTLTPAEQSAFRERTVANSAPSSVTVYAGVADTGLAGYVVRDEVQGRDQPITYAVALDAGLRVRALEILEYREAYGGEIRNESWRRQFEGKTPADVLHPGRDITVISGATISSRAVTLGVRRILILLDILRRRLPR